MSELAILSGRNLSDHQRKGFLRQQLYQISLRRKRLANAGRWTDWDFWSEQEVGLRQEFERLVIGSTTKV